LSDNLSSTSEFRPQPGMQTTFCTASETEVFYGGQAGGGKSFAMVLIAARYINEPGYKAVIFRRTYPDLEDLIHTARQIYPAMGGKLNESRHNFVWPNGSIIMFRHLQHMKDIYSHQGKEYDFIGFDELPQFPKLAYTYLFSRLRGTNPNIVRMIRGTGNPDGEGLLWVKNRFFDPMHPLEKAYFKTVLSRDVKVGKDTVGAVSRRFIPCIRSENRVLMDNDPEYENRLDQLPEDKKRALKEGLWTLMDKPDQLIQTEWWESAINGKNPFNDNGKYTIGGDFGTHHGVDKSVEVLGIGNRPHRIRSWGRTKAPQFAQILADTANSVDHSRVKIGVDSIGPGTGVADDLEIHHGLAGILDRCTHKDPRFDQKYIGDIQFDNLRSQMWWKFKTDMENGEIDLSAFQTEDGYFEDFNSLEEEILAHTFRVYNGKLIVIPKDDLRKPENLNRSPDFADALIIWNWVRRHHYEYSVDVNDQYNIDEYSKAMFKDEKEDDDRGSYQEDFFDDEFDYDDDRY